MTALEISEQYTSMNRTLAKHNLRIPEKRAFIITTIIVFGVLVYFEETIFWSALVAIVAGAINSINIPVLSYLIMERGG